MKKVLIALSICALAFSGTQVAKKATFSLEKANQQNQLQVMLQSEADVFGLQFDVNYDPADITLTESGITHMFDNSDPRSNMSVYSKIKEPGLARVLMFDLGGQAILNANNLEKVISLNYSTENGNKSTKVTINNIVAAGLHGEEVEMTTDTISDEFNPTEESFQPFETKIVGNYPNPFNPTTKIEFNLKAQGHVEVTIYDIQGRKIANLFSGVLDAQAGHVFNWDASNVASGQYFARITAPGFSDVLNMTLIK